MSATMKVQNKQGLLSTGYSATFSNASSPGDMPGQFTGVISQN